MSNNKVLIITYYWPPSGGSGVQRWLKFVKYLPQYGWEPYVFTPENPSFAIQDLSLLKDVPPEAEVIHFPIWEPYDIFFKITSWIGGANSKTPAALVSGKKKSLFQKISSWIRGNFFIPDPRVFWVKPSVAFLKDLIRENRIKTIITTGPPHSIHLIGLRLKKNNSSLNWIADFRDPWSEWGLLDSLMVSKPARAYHRKLERNVLTIADFVVTITPFYVRRFERLSSRKVTLLTNGYDEDDFKSLKVEKTDKFIIRHVGIVNEKCDPRPFMIALRELMEEQEGFRKTLQVDFVGEVHPDFKAFVSASSSLASVTTFTPSIPHKQLIELYNKSALLLLILTGYKDAEGYMPGKLFEYIATGLPVLGVGPESGDAAALINESKSGKMIDGNSKDLIKHTLMQNFGQWQLTTSQIKNLQLNKNYSRREITRKLANILK